MQANTLVATSVVLLFWSVVLVIIDTCKPQICYSIVPFIAISVINLTTARILAVVHFPAYAMQKVILAIDHNTKITALPIIASLDDAASQRASTRSDQSDQQSRFRVI